MMILIIIIRVEAGINNLGAEMRPEKAEASGIYFIFGAASLQFGT